MSSLLIRTSSRRPRPHRAWPASSPIATSASGWCRRAGLRHPVAEIMSSSLVTVEHNQLVFEAMLQMLRNNKTHLPVLKNHRPIGVIALSDIIQYESRNSLFVVSSIFRQQSVDDLAALTGDVRMLLAHGDRGRELAHDRQRDGGDRAQFQAAPARTGRRDARAAAGAVLFLALGSMARQEQLIVTDQDNALVLDNSFDPARHDDYFKALAAFVSDGLARCGYSYCTGG